MYRLHSAQKEGPAVLLEVAESTGLERSPLDASKSGSEGSRRACFSFEYCLVSGWQPSLQEWQPTEAYKREGIVSPPFRGVNDSVDDHLRAVALSFQKGDVFR